MAYAAPFSLVSFHLPDREGPAEERLTWPLAGSLAIHVVVFGAFLLSRFTASLEPSAGSYEVTLVSLQEVSSSQTASPDNESRQKADAVLPPKAETREVPKSSPPGEAASPPLPLPQEKPRVLERVTDSLVGALDAVVVPKLQTLTLPQKAAPVPPSPLPPLPVSAEPELTLKRDAGQVPLPRVDDGAAPQPERVTDSLVSALDAVVVPKAQAPALPLKSEPMPAPAPPHVPAKQAPAVEMDVQPIQAPPRPPELALGPVTAKSERSTPSPKVDLLAKTLEQAVGNIVVPRMPKLDASRVSPAVPANDERKQDKRKQDTPRVPASSRITLPAPAPRPEIVLPSESPKNEKPMETVRKHSTAEEVTQAIQSVRVPEMIRRTRKPQPVSTTVEARKRSPVVVPSAPPLAKVLVEEDPSAPAIAFERQVLHDADVRPGSQQTESGTQESLALRVEGATPKGNDYWAKVQALIDARWIVYRVQFQGPLQVILAFRVERTGQVTDLSVVRSSGNKYFDKTAERAVGAAIPLPPFPSNMRNLYYDVQYTFTGPRNQ